MFCATSYWGIVFELEWCFGYRSFPHAVMVTSREGSWQDGSKDSKGDMLFVLQMQPSVPEKSLGGEDWVVYPKGLSRFRAKTSRLGSGKQNHSLQNLSFAKGSVAGGLFLFLKTLLRSRSKLNKILKNSFGKYYSCFKQWKKSTQKGIQNQYLQMLYNHHCKYKADEKLQVYFTAIFSWSSTAHACESLSPSHINKQ